MTEFWKQTWAFPDGYVVRKREQMGGVVLNAGSLRDPNEQKPVISTTIAARRPVFVLAKQGYVAVRGKLVHPEDEGRDDMDFV